MERCRVGGFPRARLHNNRWLIPEDAIGPVRLDGDTAVKKLSLKKNVRPSMT